MADFVQTMKDWRRMCIAANGKCNNCLMDKTRMCAFGISDIGDYELQEAETIITAWAAEHPEPVYPTWEEWLITQKVIKENPNGVGNPLPKLFDSIPAEIAEKLGLEPKEG